MAGVGCKITGVLNRAAAGSRIFARQESGRVDAGGFEVRLGSLHTSAAYLGYRKAEDSSFDGLRKVVRLDYADCDPCDEVENCREVAWQSLLRERTC